MQIRCNACRGAKRILGTGCVERDCQKCDGTGFMSFEDAINSADDSPRRKRRTKEEMEAARADAV